MAWGAKRSVCVKTAATEDISDPTRADLVALGVEVLANILLECAAGDADLFDRLRLMVAVRTGVS